VDSESSILLETILGDLVSGEPRLRTTCTHEIDATQPVQHVVETLIGIGQEESG
jgi:hypothetical protein